LLTNQDEPLSETWSTFEKVIDHDAPSRGSDHSACGFDPVDYDEGDAEFADEAQLNERKDSEACDFGDIEIRGIGEDLNDASISVSNGEDPEHWRCLLRKNGISGQISGNVVFFCALWWYFYWYFWDLRSL
jgi:hypothetical protein